ncbi:MAG: polynucleotide kinase-phosphatase, partial [Chloroflexota bacterium]|nr:polynucleotide kinase-phosphatase [Chloroflexota bacterium]
MRLILPELSLVVLVGTSGSGKSTFARTHFRPTEVLSSDACRGMVSDDENSLAATSDAFEVLHFIAAKRLASGRLTVVDATNVQPEARRPLVALARQYHCIPVAVVLDLPERLCLERNRQRPDRDFGPQVIRRQHQQLRRSLGGLRREGFRHVYVLTSPQEVVESVVEREPLHCNRSAERGPFDIIGDVHGCFDELVALLGCLGYAVTRSPFGAVDAAGDAGASDRMGTAATLPGWGARHPDGRRAVFLGDLVDRGPNTPDVLRLVMGMVAAGTGLCVAGNHDVKLVRKLKGSVHVQISHGLAESLAQLQAQPNSFQEQVVGFLDGLVSHYVLDDGKLVVAHAGLKEELQGRASGRVRDFALYGETTGETDEYGLPVRFNWAAEYRGRATVVYGHTPVPDPQWLNRTIAVDTGCVFGGRLTALRYPEGDLVSVPAARVYYAPVRPLQPAADATPATSLTAQQAQDDLLDIADILGKRVIATRLRRNVTIDEAHATAALETMTRFTIDPRWLIYLPPTMSPPQTSHATDRLEHPAEAFAYYAAEGVERIVCEEKHMG